jgi:hypothetical protein
MGTKVPNPCPTHDYKGMSAAARLKCRACRVSETFAHAHTLPGETGAHSRNASIPARYGNSQRPRAVISNGHVRHVSRDARVHHFTCIYHVAHDDHYNYNPTPAKHSQAIMATIKHKSP